MVEPVTFTWKPRKATTRIIIHESHTPRSVTNAVDLLRAQGRVNGLLEIGYHYVIENDGRATITRPHHVIGSHAPGCNHDSIGICIAADKDWLPHENTEQLNMLQYIYGKLTLAYGQLPVLGRDQVVRRRNPDHKCPSFDMELVRRWIITLP